MMTLQQELNFLKQQRTAQWEVKKLLQQGLRDMRLQQLRKVHETQEGQQSTHQKMEIDNLEDSHKKSEKELRRKQYLEAKQRPKEYKAIEVSLKKKYDELCRAKRKSFKEKQKKLTETTPREELEECLRRLKKDQMIHLQELAQEYSKNLNEMLENATSQFDFRHQEENTSLIAKHNEALKSLKQFQNQRKDRSKLRHMAEVDELKRLLLLKQEEFNRQFQEDIDRCVKDSETKIAEAKERQRLEIEDHLAHYKIPEWGISLSLFFTFSFFFFFFFILYLFHFFYHP